MTELELLEGLGRHHDDVAIGCAGLAQSIHGPLGDGRILPGFVAAASSTTAGVDLTSYGGWRGWRAAGSPR